MNEKSCCWCSDKNVKVRKVYLYKDMYLGFVHINGFWKIILNSFTNDGYCDILDMLDT